MAFRRRRRRFQGRWFPTDIRTAGLQLVSTKAGSWDASVAVSAQNIIVTAGDVPSAFEVAGTASLQQVVGPGSSYLIKRIVGDLDVSAYQANNLDSHGYAFFGMFVDRTDAQGTLNNLAAWQPFGALTTQAVGNMQKRWLFRRYWHLGNSASAVNLRDPVFPPYTASWYGNGLTGTHVNSKGKARVTWEERLFSLYAVTGGSSLVADNTQWVCQFTVNLRLFAYPTMRDNR